MSLFDRIAQSLDRMLSSPATALPEDEAGHLDLLEQSSGRMRDTIEAIKRGNLVAASSTTEDLRFERETRYQDLVGGSRKQPEGFAAALSPRAESSHVERLANHTQTSTLVR